MDGITAFLEVVRSAGLAVGHFRGLLHVVIGRRLTKTDGTLVSRGITWRELAALLKTLRFDRDLVREFGADPDALAPRDRERFWYAAIAQARVDSREAVDEADRLVAPLKTLGYVVGPPPTVLPPAAPPPPETPSRAAEDTPKKRKKKG